MCPRGLDRFLARPGEQSVGVLDREAGAVAVERHDLAGLDRAGVDRRELAHRLYQLYMRQLFVTNFVHADESETSL